MTGSVPTLSFAPGAGGVPVDLDRLVASRLLAQANSGGGKSRALRYLLEQTHGRVQHLILDPEGEFFTLRERFPYLLAGREGDVPADPKTARLLCRRLMELGASAVLDLYDLKLDQRREFVRLFLEELMHLPRALWRPVLIVIDEAHVFAPERGSGESQSTEAVITLATQGRKRGYSLVAATQRLSKLHKDVAAELLNKLIGRTGLDVDLKRAGDELGFDKEQRQALKHLAPGTFYVYGPAIATEVTLVRTGDVATTHPEPGAIGAAAPPAPAAVAALVGQLKDLPQQAAEEARTIEELQALVRQLRADLKRAQASAPAHDPAATGALVERELRALAKHVERDHQRLAGRVAQLQHIAERARGAIAAIDDIDGVIEELAGALRAPVDVYRDGHADAAERRATIAAPVVPVAPQRREVRAADGAVSGPQQRMLDALAAFEAIGLERLANGQLAVFSDQSPRSSGFRANLSTLSAAGLVERLPGQLVRLTDEGRRAATGSVQPATLAELQDAWMAKVSGPQRMMLQLLIREHPGGIDRDELARSSGQSPLSSGYRANLSTLSALGLLRRQSGEIIATELLFPEGLR